MTDAATKVPRPCCGKCCSPFPKCCCFFSGDPHSLPLRTPPLSPAPFAVLVAVPPFILSQQLKGPRQGRLRAKAGRFGARHHLGATRGVWGPKKSSSQGPGELAPKKRARLRKAESEALAVKSPGAWVCSEERLLRGGLWSRDAEGSVSPRVSAERDSSEQPLWLNWGGKEEAGKGGRGITLRNLLVPNR